ncbi:DoxX family protein [Brucella anthropi]|jgi:transmembrane protein|uniref:DoxX family protein n=1 Tax=Brucella lupini TaxID=255457 RepID=A0A256GIQ5_9HYPH|nr:MULTISPECIES: DoxX family protein [Brucella/Ochrobactrum group]QOD66742.1 DoxX family protein [Ochrobactrum sp. MT180101]QTN05454.1 DoxX family membrane protein [Ochrobactrum sp. EEELCW01]RNL47603.1 DoxX family protein [Ochrobactrum sp. MH181795]KAB2704963.1 DoxX family protein [Brucella lupini]KAB2724952.1 DoxX family protein [Brucella anthropi]
MPRFIANILDSHASLLLARVVLTFIFWSSGLAKLFNFGANAAEMESFGLHPGWLFNSATLLLQIVGSLMIIFNRGIWLACGALAVFTILTIPVAHPFWAKEGEEAFRDMTVALEHISLIGGLALAAILSRKV